IVRRNSSDEMVMADRVVATALYMIRQEACEGLGVSDLVERLNVSRSTLERRMRAAIGRAPKAEILRHRFLRVEELLRSSDKTVETIAEEAGFEHPNYLHQVFRQRYGMTPNQFRQSFATR
ncbi:MAG: helix-turn-helix transcriptional regulator, partial [Akkermansiaceae bacterium]